MPRARRYTVYIEYDEDHELDEAIRVHRRFRSQWRLSYRDAPPVWRSRIPMSLAERFRFWTKPQEEGESMESVQKAIVLREFITEFSLCMDRDGRPAMGLSTRYDSSEPFPHPPKPYQNLTWDQFAEKLEERIKGMQALALCLDELNVQHQELETLKLLRTKTPSRTKQ